MFNNRLGFMQGRLVDQVDGKIQAFPSATWKDEFPIAQEIGISNIEWTLDHQELGNNPLCTEAGRRIIRSLSDRHKLNIASITGDCFMQAPFWKCSVGVRSQLLSEFDLIVESAAEMNARLIVLPLVDNGRLENTEQRSCFISECIRRSDFLVRDGIRIVIESDFPPFELSGLISELPAESFGINYDVGNSASLGYNPREEFSAYGDRVYHVHMKDRLLGGTTVPLGQGDASFDKVFQELARIDYSGLIILQTARAEPNNHARALERYASFTQALMEKYFGF